jgi:hypothetical protein
MSCPPEAVRPAGNENGPVFFLDQPDQCAGCRERREGEKIGQLHELEVDELASLSPSTVVAYPLLERRLEGIDHVR